MDFIEVSEAKGEVQDHSEESALVGDGRDGADFELGWEVLPEFLPGYETGETPLHFLHCLVVQSGGSNAVLSGWMGAPADGGVEQAKVPVWARFGRAALVGKIEE